MTRTFSVCMCRPIFAISGHWKYLFFLRIFIACNTLQCVVNKCGTCFKETPHDLGDNFEVVEKKKPQWATRLRLITWLADEFTTTHWHWQMKSKWPFQCHPMNCECTFSPSMFSSKCNKTNNTFATNENE